MLILSNAVHKLFYKFSPAKQKITRVQDKFRKFLKYTNTNVLSQLYI